MTGHIVREQSYFERTPFLSSSFNSGFKILVNCCIQMGCHLSRSGQPAAVSTWPLHLVEGLVPQPPDRAVRFPSPAASPLLSLRRAAESGPCSGLGFGFMEGCGWLVSPDLQNCPHSSSKSFRFLSRHVFPGVALVVPLQDVSFAFTAWLSGAEPSFQPAPAFGMLFSPR